VGEARVVDGDIFGVDDVHGHAGVCVAVEAGGRVDLQGGADCEEDIGPLNKVDGFLDVGNGLAEKDDVGAPCARIPHVTLSPNPSPREMGSPSEDGVSPSAHLLRFLPN